MKKTTLFLLYLAATFLGIACTQQSPEEEADLKAAQEIHRQILDKEAALLKAYQAVATDTIPGAMTQWKTAFDDWEKRLVSVPGLEDAHHHDHDHAEGHHHHHHADPKLTPAQLLEVQQALLEELQTLETRWQALNAP
ncbi:MAG: hypothetical protein ACFCUI_11630 [Bernardetiaceae bacterium]